MNTFGTNFRITTFGESHGPAVGAVIDGCPAGLALAESDIQPLLDRRRPGTSALVSPRDEKDRVEILSGVFEGRTTGTPIALLVRNEQQQSKDYEELRTLFRPGHADFTYQQKYGCRDHRGGGRSSGRETLGRVAAGAVAMKFLAGKGIVISGGIVSVHGKTGTAAIEAAILGCKEYRGLGRRDRRDHRTGLPAGLGDPVFGKLDAQIAGCHDGHRGGERGRDRRRVRGGRQVREREQRPDHGRTGFLSNHAGGILGGISSGQEIVVRIAVKPTPSIARAAEDHRHPRQ